MSYSWLLVTKELALLCKAKYFLKKYFVNLSWCYFNIINTRIQNQSNSLYICWRYITFLGRPVSRGNLKKPVQFREYPPFEILLQQLWKSLTYAYYWMSCYCLLKLFLPYIPIVTCHSITFYLKNLFY